MDKLLRTVSLQPAGTALAPARPSSITIAFRSTLEKSRRLQGFLPPQVCTSVVEVVLQDISGPAWGPIRRGQISLLLLQSP